MAFKAALGCKQLAKILGADAVFFPLRKRPRQPIESAQRAIRRKICARWQLSHARDGVDDKPLVDCHRQRLAHANVRQRIFHSLLAGRRTGRKRVLAEESQKTGAEGRRCAQVSAAFFLQLRRQLTDHIRNPVHIARLIKQKLAEHVVVHHHLDRFAFDVGAIPILI